MVTMEPIVSRDPDLLISLCRVSKEYRDSEQWLTLRAVRNGKIIDNTAIDWNAILHQGPRLVDGMESLEKAVQKVLLEEK